VVEGSVRVDGDRLRVTTQLIDAQSGYHLWSEQYDRRIRDVFAMQEEIARAIATALSAELAQRLPDTLVSTTTANPAAYRLYLRGRHEWRKRTEDGMRAALDAFQEAVVLDPTYAAAYAGLADTWQLLPDYADVASGEGLARAKTAALRAVALDSTLAEAQVALAALLDDYDRDRRGAEVAYRRAIELSPGYATARHWLGIHLADDGRFEEALEQIEDARRLDPLSAIVNTAVGAVRYFARDYDGAVAEYRSVLDLQPDFALGWALLGRVQLVDGRVDEAVASLERSVELSGGDPSYRAVYATALAADGRTTEARAIADEVRGPYPDGYVPYCELASAYLYLGDDEQALALFEEAFDQRDPALKHIRVEPLYDRIRAHPDFVDLMRRAGFDGA
jgi:tetratricopeptide (TPR) repeat protein